MKCTADGNPRPKVTWSKLNSSLPVSRYEVEPSGALIVKEVRPGDDGVYSCRAENLLGQVNKSAKLSVQCKLKYLLYLMRLKIGNINLYSVLERKKTEEMVHANSWKEIAFK